MPDISHLFGADLALGPTGDLATVDGAARSQQRVLRRLLTNPLDYIWQVPYGGGLARYVGQLSNAPAIRGVVLAQMAQEAAVAPLPVPIVAVASDNNGTVLATVTYGDAATGQTTVLSVPVGP